MDDDALRPNESELVKLSASVQQTEPPQKKKKGPKGPNPLSIKKKKPTVPQPTQSTPKSEPTFTGSKRKSEGEAPGEIGQAPGGGHKRKRRRKMETEPFPDHDSL